MSKPRNRSPIKILIFLCSQQDQNNYLSENKTIWQSQKWRKKTKWENLQRKTNSVAKLKILTPLLFLRVSQHAHSETNITAYHIQLLNIHLHTFHIAFVMLFNVLSNLKTKILLYFIQDQKKSCVSERFFKWNLNSTITLCTWLKNSGTYKSVTTVGISRKEFTSI